MKKLKQLICTSLFILGGLSVVVVYAKNDLDPIVNNLSNSIVIKYQLCTKYWKGSYVCGLIIPHQILPGDVWTAHIPDDPGNTNVLSILSAENGPANSKYRIKDNISACSLQGGGPFNAILFSPIGKVGIACTPSIGSH